jgi:hypothetical protein
MRRKVLLMASRVVLLLTLAVAFGSRPQANDDVHKVYETAGCGVVDFAAVVPESAFVSGDVQRLARDFAAGHRSSPLYRATYGVASREVELSLAQNPSPGVTTGRRLETVKEVWPPVHPITTVIGLGSSAVLITNNGDGSISRQVIFGSDPTRLGGGGFAFDLLHFHLTMSADKIPDCGVTVYVHSPSKPPSRACGQLTRTLKARIGVGYVAVVCLTTYWNIGDPDFPLIYPFAPATPAPSAFETRFQPRIGCSIGPRFPLHCTGGGSD